MFPVSLCTTEKFGKDRVDKKTIKIRVIVRRLFICFHIASLIGEFYDLI